MQPILFTFEGLNLSPEFSYYEEHIRNKVVLYILIIVGIPFGMEKQPKVQNKLCLLQ